MLKLFICLLKAQKSQVGFLEVTMKLKVFLILIKKEGDLLDKLIGYSYFILRIPYYLILLALKKEKKIEFMVTVLAVMIFFKQKILKIFMVRSERLELS